MKKSTYYISANDFVEAQTKALERIFHCSRPRPRNKAMGFKGEDKKKKPTKPPTF